MHVSRGRYLQAGSLYDNDVEIVALVYDKVGKLPCEDGQTTMADALPTNLFDLRERSTLARLNQLILDTKLDGVLILDHRNAPSSVLQNAIEKCRLARAKEPGDDQHRNSLCWADRRLRRHASSLLSRAIV